MHPSVKIHVLIKQASNYYERRYGVQNWEYSDAYHQFLEFISFRTIVFHDGANPEERHEASKEEDGAQHQVHAKRGHNEIAKRFHVPNSHVAHAAQNVSWNNKKSV